MKELLNNPTSDNERNILNADLFVSNLRNTLKAFKFNTKITYEVYRSITIYHLSWNDDKTYGDILKLKKEISLSLGIHPDELKIVKIKDNEVKITINNMKIESLSLKELLVEFKKDDSFKLPIGLNEYDKIVSLDFDKDKSLLVAGLSGSGKTNLFNSLILNLLINYPSVKVIVMDSQGINYNQYNSVIDVINKEENIINRIHSLRKEFEKRVKDNNKEPLVVFIDEIYEIIKMDMAVKDDINYLLELGSMMNIHLVISTDSISVDDINDIFDRNNISKLSFELTSRGEYNMFFDMPVTMNNKNTAVYLNYDKEMSKIIIPLVKDEEKERIIKKIEGK